MHFNNVLYINDIQKIMSYPLNWSFFSKKNVLVTGATGLIGTFLIDILMYRNIEYNNHINIYAVSRNEDKALKHFSEYNDSQFFNLIIKDIRYPINDLNISIDYIIHGASNTHPVAYSTEPINTIMLSILGTKSILDLASFNNVKRTLFLSSVEIYGENRGDVESFNEEYLGYIDCNTLRAGYPEGKRACESLCQAYIKEKNIDIIIARCARTFGPTMNNEDSKVIAQFIKNAVKGENIILKSKGEQLFSYCYAADVCYAILFLLINGENTHAYNIANSELNYSLLQIAAFLSEHYKSEIIFDCPSNLESAGFSKATNALLSCFKINKLGWTACFPVKESLINTIDILRQCTLPNK